MDSKAMSIALLVIGSGLIIVGINANQSASSEVSRLFTGAPTNKALFLLIGGVISAIVGFMGLTRK